MKYLAKLPFFFHPLALVCSGLAIAETAPSTVSIWRNLLHEKSDCVTWVSVTVRIEVSAGGRSFPPSEKKLEALGTVLAEDGLVVLSLNKVDPTDIILSRMRTPGDINVNYTEVLILRPDGTEIEADFLLKDADLDLAFIRPHKKDTSSSNSLSFQSVHFDSANPPKIQALDEVVSLGKLGRNLYRKSTLQRGWVNAVIEKPRDYYVVENVTPGTPVFNHSGQWIGITAFRKEGGKPSGVITVPAKDVMEIAEQVRERTD
ncbi:MAG: trypsin-like peptidase domain-containing protein [Opitutae bacterium]